MTRRKLIPFLLTPLLFMGCLTFDTIETRISIQEEKDKPATLSVVYKGISSSEAKDKDVRGDFEYLIEEWQGDEYLVDQAKEGIIVKSRDVWEENGELNSSMTGLVPDLNTVYDFWDENGERIMRVDMDAEEYELVETNGKILATERNRLIVWPKDERELYWKLKLVVESESIEANRPKMKKMWSEFVTEMNKKK